LAILGNPELIFNTTPDWSILNITKTENNILLSSSNLGEQSGAIFHG
jgi:hypothetical protein